MSLSVAPRMARTISRISVSTKLSVTSPVWPELTAPPGGAGRRRRRYCGAALSKSRCRLRSLGIVPFTRGCAACSVVGCSKGSKPGCAGSWQAVSKTKQPVGASCQRCRKPAIIAAASPVAGRRRCVGIRPRIAGSDRGSRRLRRRKASRRLGRARPALAGLSGRQRFGSTLRLQCLGSAGAAQRYLARRDALDMPAAHSSPFRDSQRLVAAHRKDRETAARRGDDPGQPGSVDRCRRRLLRARSAAGAACC